MLYPFFAMVVLTVVVGLVAFRARYLGVHSGEVKIKYFRTMQGQSAPDAIIQSTRCFNNQFELPVLFYVAGLLGLIFEQGQGILLVLAWVFVGSRVVHAYILLTYNNVVHRIYAYWLGVIVVLAMWVYLVITHSA